MDLSCFYKKFQIWFNKTLDSLLSLILFSMSSCIPISIKIRLQCQYKLTYMCRALKTGFWEDQNQWHDNIHQSLGSDYRAVYEFFSLFNLAFALRLESLALLEVSDFSHTLHLLCWPKSWTVTKMRVQKTASEVLQLGTIFLVNVINRNPWSQACTNHYLPTWNS